MDDSQKKPPTGEEPDGGKVDQKKVSQEHNINSELHSKPLIADAANILIALAKQSAPDGTEPVFCKLTDPITGDDKIKWPPIDEATLKDRYQEGN